MSDWENNGINDLLNSAVYANALCTCADESSPCAQHALDAFKVWLYAADIRLKNNGSNGVTHSYAGADLNRGEQLSLSRVMSEAFYYGRIPWGLSIHPHGRQLTIAYQQRTGRTSRTAWYELRYKDHNWDRTHSVNLPYIQFVMAMNMPRPSPDNDAPHIVMEEVADRDTGE